MLVGRVVGEVWSTKKHETLVGLRLLMIDPIEGESTAKSGRPMGLIVAADPVGAGVGEEVVVAYGRAGRVAIGRGHDIAVEAAVVGIVDGRTGGAR